MDWGADSELTLCSSDICDRAPVTDGIRKNRGDPLAAAPTQSDSQPLLPPRPPGAIPRCLPYMLVRRDSRAKGVRKRRRLEGRELQRTRAAGHAAPDREWKHLEEYMRHDLSYLLPVVHCTLYPPVLLPALAPPDGPQVRHLPSPLGPRPSPRVPLQRHQQHKRNPKDDPRRHRASHLLLRDRLLERHPSPTHLSRRWVRVCPGSCVAALKADRSAYMLD